MFNTYEGGWIPPHLTEDDRLKCSTRFCYGDSLHESHGQQFCKQCWKLFPAKNCTLAEGDDVVTRTGRTGVIVEDLNDACQFNVRMNDTDDFELWDFDLLEPTEVDYGDETGTTDAIVYGQRVEVVASMLNTADLQVN